ncbi:MAG: hypothetical protein WDZ68_00325 [Candidatus Paceibacterota bacterium]
MKTHAINNYKTALFIGISGLLAFGIAGIALASNHFVSPDPFTQTELDNNWEADRQFPSDGASSTSAFGRDDVARIGIDSTETAPGNFQRTEGIKTVGDKNFGDAVEVDLYLDPDWEDNATRAGFWVVGDDGDENTTGTASRDDFYGILEFVNNELCDVEDCTNQSNITDHEGWRFWDSVNGWTDLATDFTYGEWVTLGIELDTDAEVYNFYINGDLVGSGPGGENFIRELFLNSYNYGLDTFPNLGNDSYAAHWHVWSNPEAKDECKDGGYEAFGFSNQGRCIQFVNTGMDSR